MNKKYLLIFILTIFLLISFNVSANELIINSNLNQINFEINDPQDTLESNKIILNIVNNSFEKNKYPLFLSTSHLKNENNEIITSDNFKLFYLKKSGNRKFNLFNRRMYISRRTEKIVLKIVFDKDILYFPPGEYRGKLIIAEGRYTIPIFLKINPFAQVIVNKERIHLKLKNIPFEISNKEEVEIVVKTNLQDWQLKFEFSKDFTHEDGKSSFPLENVFYSKKNDFINSKNKKFDQSDNNFKKANYLYPAYFSKDKNTNISNNNGEYTLKLNIWADIRENWNRAKAGEYEGEILFTFINI